jgi:hypothetical protein
MTAYLNGSGIVFGDGNTMYTNAMSQLRNDTGLLYGGYFGETNRNSYTIGWGAGLYNNCNQGYGYYFYNCYPQAYQVNCNGQSHYYYFGMAVYFNCNCNCNC